MFILKEKALEYIIYLKQPIDITDNKYWTREENLTIKKFQENIRELFSSLKNDNCINFEDVFHQIHFN